MCSLGLFVVVVVFCCCWYMIMVSIPSPSFAPQKTSGQVTTDLLTPFWWYRMCPWPRHAIHVDSSPLLPWGFVYQRCVTVEGPSPVLACGCRSSLVTGSCHALLL